MPPALLVIGLLPHAIPELVVLFMPLAAWLIASHKNRWDELLAATAVCVVVAVPVLLAAAAIELWVSPHLVTHLAGSDLKNDGGPAEAGPPVLLALPRRGGVTTCRRPTSCCRSCHRPGACSGT